ncbi:porin [Variovorax paradoxus]|uniref:Porin n=1 Tax=Variovorax paradoxus TaxID=34073 RepID=A0A5Q0M657_VARPD|nr:porin [Variovorax paradoxus]QFZ84064.1 porin [Variovorax paradoxus]
MKQHHALSALALLTVAGAAPAQSSVTVFGIVDVGISRYTSKSTHHSPNPFAVPPATAAGGAKKSQTAMSNSGYAGSRIGFRGTEDLGGGLAASFWLESGISNDDGAKGIDNFNRRSTLSLSGPFGEVRLGRDYTATFWNDTVFSPFGTQGVGTNLMANINSRLAAAAGPGSVVGATDNYVRTGNSIGYFLPPNLGGVYGQLQYALHENTKRSDQAGTPSAKGRFVGGRFGYAKGPLDMAIAYSQSTAADSTTLNALGLVTAKQERKINSLNLGASYDFGPAKLFGELSRVQDKNETGALQNLPGLAAPLMTTTTRKDRYDGYLLGVSVPVGAGLIRASYASVKYKNGAPAATDLNSLLWGLNGHRDTTANQIALGYVHNLSKRTALYASVSRIRIKNGWNNPGVMGAITGGSVSYLAGGTAQAAGWAPRSSMGYDFGIRHAF